MKKTSKIACLLFLVAFYDTSFGMMRFARQTSPAQRTSVQRAAQTKTFATTAKNTPSFYSRIHQALRNAWTNFTNRFSRAPAIKVPQPTALQQPLAEILTTPMQTPPITPTLSSMLRQTNQPELKTSQNIAQEIKPVLKAIELSKEKNSPEKKETSLMVCTPPGIEIDFISALQSFDEIKSFIRAQKVRILTEAGLDDKEIHSIFLQLDNNQKYIYEHAYTVPNKPVIHDATLDPNIMQEIKMKLRRAGINPFCVNIINKSKEKMDGAFAMAIGPARINDTLFTNPILIFSQELIDTRTRETTGFIISHEIGHLILCHGNAGSFLKEHITQILRKKNGLSKIEKRKMIMGKNNEFFDTAPRDPLYIKVEKIVKDTLGNLQILFELEADITYSLYDKNVAENSLRSVLKTISSGTSDTATMPSDVHQADNTLYHWLKRIRDLHKTQEAEKE